MSENNNVEIFPLNAPAQPVSDTTYHELEGPGDEYAVIPAEDPYAGRCDLHVSPLQLCAVVYSIPHNVFNASAMSLNVIHCTTIFPKTYAHAQIH